MAYSTNIDTALTITSAVNVYLEKFRIHTQNIANAETAGYKSLLIRTSHQHKHHGNVLKKIAIDNSFRKGTFIKTGDPLNVMAGGNAFFAVKSDRNGTIYTSDGRFSIDNENRLISINGDPVLDMDGNEILIPTEAKGIHIRSTGEIMNSDNAIIARLGVFEFENLNNLTHIGTSAFKPNNETAVAVAFPNLRDGGYEASNVNTVYEMASVQDIGLQIKRLATNQRLSDSLLKEQTPEKLVKTWA